MSKRLARLNEQFKREISELIRTQVRDPRVGLVTVTHVQVAADLGSARVRVRLSGDDAERAEALQGLEAAAPFLRRMLGQILRLRHIPELRFGEDRSLEHAQRIEAILSEVLPEDEVPEDEPSDGDASGPDASGDDEAGDDPPRRSDDTGEPAP